MSAENLRYQSIDSLRGYAAFLVSWFHLFFLWNMFYDLPFLKNIFTHFQHAVQLFFIISGFTLSLMYDKNSANRSTMTFYLKRFLRIAPLFYSALAISFIYSLYSISYISVKFSLFTIISNITFIFNLLPDQSSSLVMAGWTIGVEMIFYLLFPFLIRITQTIKSLLLFLFLSLVASISIKYFLGHNAGSNYFIYYSFLIHLPAFLLGMLCLKTYQNLLKKEEHVKKKYSMFFMIMFLIIVFFEIKGIIPRKAHIYGWQFASALLVMSMLLQPSKILINKMSEKLGTISYSFYLMHSPVLAAAYPAYLWLHGKSLNPVALFLLISVLFTLTVFLISKVTYNYIEKPFIQLGNRFNNIKENQYTESLADIARFEKAT